MAGFSQIVTANALRSGRVVWLDADGGWTQDMRRALVLTDPDTAKAALARAQAQAADIVGAYLADARVTPDGPQPTHFREAFRRDGPSAAARIPSKGA